MNEIIVIPVVIPVGIMFYPGIKTKTETISGEYRLIFFGLAPGTLVNYRDSIHQNFSIRKIFKTVFSSIEDIMAYIKTNEKLCFIRQQFEWHKDVIAQVVVSLLPSAIVSGGLGKDRGGSGAEEIMSQSALFQVPKYQYKT